MLNVLLFYFFLYASYMNTLECGCLASLLLHHNDGVFGQMYSDVQ